MRNSYTILWLEQRDLVQEAEGLQVTLTLSSLDYGSFLVRQFHAG